jgi:hypothetical protein
VRRTLQVCLVHVVLFSPIPIAAQPWPSRQTRSLNEGWRFQRQVNFGSAVEWQFRDAWKLGLGRACTMEAKAFSFTHRTKVFAGGTGRKNGA